MKFAVISDIHGNLPALDAVIEDAEKQNVDAYIFAGDYCISNPYSDECITRIRNRRLPPPHGRRLLNCGKGTRLLSEA